MLQLSLLCDGAFREEDASMSFSIAVYYGSPLCGLLIKHLSRLPVVNTKPRRATSTEAEYAAALFGLIYMRVEGLENGLPIMVWSDCQSVVDKINDAGQDWVKSKHYPNLSMKHNSIIGH